MINDLMEILESREAILKKHIDGDREWEHDRVNGQFFKGRIVIEEHWLEETRKIIDYIKKNGG